MAMRDVVGGALLLICVCGSVFADVPPDVLSTIKASAAADFPGDFVTQRFMIEDQKAAYLAIQSYSPHGVPEPILQGIKSKASADFPMDFSTQKFMIDEQAEAYRELQQ